MTHAVVVAVDSPRRHRRPLRPPGACAEAGSAKAPPQDVGPRSVCPQRLRTAEDVKKGAPHESIRVAGVVMNDYAATMGVRCGTGAARERRWRN